MSIASSEFCWADSAAYLSDQRYIRSRRQVPAQMLQHNACSKREVASAHKCSAGKHSSMHCCHAGFKCVCPSVSRPGTGRNMLCMHGSLETQEGCSGLRLTS